MIEEIMKDCSLDRWNLLMGFKIDEERYITAYNGEILNCISFLLKDGNDYWVLEKGNPNDEFWNAPYKIEPREKLDGFDYRFFPRTDCTKELTEEYKKQAKKMGFKVYDEFQKKMPSRLRPFNDEKPFYVEVPSECEDIDGNKQKSTFIKVLIEYNKFRNTKEHHYSFEYATGGSSLHISDGDMKQLLKQSLNCHNISYEEKKQEVYTQMNIFDLLGA